MIHTGEPPFAIPCLIDPLAEQFPDVNIIIAHGGNQAISYDTDAINVARHYPNVYFETSWCHIHTLIEAASVLGPEKVIFGSDSAPYEIWSQVLPIVALTQEPPIGVNLSEGDLWKILGGNIARLLQLP